VRPADLSAVDAIVTIGKSVPYAIAAAKPVYMYDRFGGDGWLTRGNFAVSLDHNFSGRPAQRRLSSGEIAREIVAGFAQADEEMRHIRTARTMRLLTLDHHLSALRGRAIMRTADPTGWLRQELKRPLFRARMMLSRSKRHVARRAFLASRTRNV
jgi:hypothetical protein